MSDRNSILGVRGSEDLGGGLQAFFQLETLFPADVAATSFANRNSGVGLRGAWGVLLAAYQDSQDGGASSAATHPACTLVGLGYRYDFTKRTSFIAELAVVDNKAGSLCNFGTSPLTISAGQDPRGFAAGLRHLF